MMTYIIVLKVLKFGEDRFSCFEIVIKNVLGGGGGSPNPNKVNTIQPKLFLLLKGPGGLYSENLIILSS